ncbi:MAG: hypothetical protein V5A55_02390 [Halovenus sp.]
MHCALCGGETHRSSDNYRKRSDAGGTGQVLLTDGGEPPEDDTETGEEVLDAGDIVDADQFDGRDGTADEGAGERQDPEETERAAEARGPEDERRDPGGGRQEPFAGTGGSGTGEQKTPVGGNRSAGKQTEPRSPAGGRDGPGRPAGGYQGGETGIVAQLAALPLQVGGVLGALVVAVPYLVMTVVVTVFHERNVVVEAGEAGALDIGAEIVLSLFSFGSAARIRDWFLFAADVDLAAVDPADYPSFSEELAAILAFVDGAPAALLLGLYLVVPYLLFWSGARLASKQAPGETAGDHLKAGMTVTVGVLPLVFVLAAVFTVVGFGTKVLVGGVVAPLVFGGAGGLTVWAYDESLRTSRLLGVGAILVGVVTALVLVPQASPVRFSMADRLTFGLMGYLEVSQFSVGSETELRLLFVVTVAAAVAAGFLRTWSIRERVPNATEGARIGASIAYGFVWPIALLLWMVPVLLILTGTTPFGLGETNALNRSLAGYRNAVVLAGIVLPAITGAVGGYTAIWYRNQEEEGERPQPPQ